MIELGGDLLPDDRVTDEIVEAWLGGLRRNPALPASVFVRLLAVDDGSGHARWLNWCTLDREMTATALASPVIEHRLAVIENSTADVDALVALTRDPSPRVRFVFAAVGCDFRQLPAEVPEILARDSEARVRVMATQWGLPPHVRARLVEDEDARVREAALTRELWPHLSVSVREALLADPEPTVREAAAAILSDPVEDLPEPWGGRTRPPGGGGRTRPAAGAGGARIRPTTTAPRRGAGPGP
ncbi:HEAT repeat domain-containing protein, partial [Streptomyces virginiae]|uniref:HEAT repeat domain-containing protein n=1 Tax=Streptomyces virginiae TaxID=1961 RepID=UPI00364B26D6